MIIYPDRLRTNKRIGTEDSISKKNGWRFAHAKQNGWRFIHACWNEWQVIGDHKDVIGGFEIDFLWFTALIFPAFVRQLLRYIPLLYPPAFLCSPACHSSSSPTVQYARHSFAARNFF
jgi:hypothetical protein